MSAPGAGTPGPASDLQDLFASLRSSTVKNRAVSSSGSPAPTSNKPPAIAFASNVASPAPLYLEQRQSATMSPSFSPPLYGSQSRGFPSNTGASQSNTPAQAGDRPSSDRTASLLNLLKFSTPAPSSQPPLPHPSVATPPELGNVQINPRDHSVHGRGISASDLVASYMGKPSTPTPLENEPHPSSTNHQDFLLKLLNRTTASQATHSEEVPKPPADTQTTPQNPLHDLPDRTIKKPPVSGASDKQSLPSPRNDSPIRVFGSGDDREPTPFEPHDLPKVEPASKKDSIFTYVNPFEQLAASSPRNAKPKVANGDAHKRKIIEPLAVPAQSTSRRKLSPTSNDVLESIESPIPNQSKDGRSQIEALMGIGAPSRNAETVAEALNEVGDKLDKEVEYALAKAEENERDTEIKEEVLGDMPEVSQEALENKVKEIASEIKQELDKDENKGLLEEALTHNVAETVKDVIDQAAQGNLGEEWESAEGEYPKPKMQSKRAIKVYQFPMKPFVVIDIKPKELPTLTLRDDSLTHIARLKKEFDQSDRTLATATNDFIIYGSPKSGGLKVIRQDDGLAKHIFHNTHDRIFNVSISAAHPASPSRGIQNIIATGLSGTVYWATILKPGEDVFEHDMEEQGLIFPPSPAQSDNSSGGQLKTRAKKSCRNPEFFAVGRGKSIHIVFPEHARKSEFLQDRSIVDTDNYFKDRNLRINTGKAGKDFTFSEDDSTILTLDKTGRLRFWDIRDLRDENNATASTLAPVEVKNSIITYITAHPSEKSWPTSVLLVDKVRPYTKGIALRYVIVGMKQNHTLQLWDLCLGKAVQEVNFPHENESDPICSITYHPNSGIVVVGHPTRNSICLLHLSAPKYNLPPISQAKFVQRLANKDSTLPKPEATAILSGVREYSFANIGQIRSVELVPSSGEQTRSTEDDDDPMLFELYVMHSKGVTCLGIRKEDLGWSKGSKVENPVDAEKEGYITVKDLREPHLSSVSELSSTNDAPSTSTAIKTHSNAASKATHITVPSRDGLHETASAPVSSPSWVSNPEKAEKKKKKRSATTPDHQFRESDRATVPTATSAAPKNDTDSYAHVAQRAPPPATDPISNASNETIRPHLPSSTSVDAPELMSKTTQEYSAHPLVNAEPINLGVSSDFLDKELKKIEKGVSGEISKVLNRELSTLYQRFAEDKRVQDAAGAAKQDAILRLVSSTLGDNVEKSLSRIITTNMQQVVLPSVINVTSSTIEKRISEVIIQQIHHAIPSLLKLALPEAISRGIQDPDVLRVLSEQVTSRLTSHVEKEFTATLHNTIIPAFKNLAINVAQKSGLDTENRIREHLRRAETQHKNDSTKIDQLALLVRGLSETVHTMAAAQSEFQQQILNLQHRATQGRRSSTGASSSQDQSNQASSEARMTPKSPEQEELEMITNLMTEGRFEEGTIQVCASLNSKASKELT